MESEGEVMGSWRPWYGEINSDCECEWGMRGRDSNSSNIINTKITRKQRKKKTKQNKRAGE